jgi:hypothetical protein
MPQPVNKDLEELMDAFAYLLATTADTSGIAWILGDIGMGKPQQLPFGYISQLNEAVNWYSANGGQGGLASAANTGLDDWQIQVALTVAYQQHQHVNPVLANPSAGSAFAGLDIQLPYQEQPGWRGTMKYVQQVKGTLRQNIVVGGFAATTRIVEAKPVQILVGDVLFRAVRITLQTQQRRRRGT